MLYKLPTSYTNFLPKNLARKWSLSNKYGNLLSNDWVPELFSAYSTELDSFYTLIQSVDKNRHFWPPPTSSWPPSKLSTLDNKLPCLSKFFHFTANQMRRQSTTEEILIARGFRRESTTEDIMRCRNVRSGQVSKLWEINSWKVLTWKKVKTVVKC